MAAPELFPGVQIHHDRGTYAVLDAGAQVLTWTPPGRQPVLWESPLARFEPGVAVRGGVPVIFPWFGAGTSGERTPAHGFARTAAWTRASVVDDVQHNGRLEVRHTLTAEGLDSAPFEAELTTVFGRDELRVTLTVTNPGPNPYTYEEALHTYFSVSDVARVAIEGLDGSRYLDKVNGSTLVQAGPVRFTGETDRIYDHSGEVVIDDPGRGRRVEIAKEGSADTVVWNPGAQLGRSMADVGEYHVEFVCVEAANIGGNAITLAPGESHSLAQTICLS